MTTATTERQPLTDRQREVLAWIAHFTASNGKQPTAGQVCRAFASRWINGAPSILRQLSKRGCVTWKERGRKNRMDAKNESRSVEPEATSVASQQQSLPLTESQRAVYAYISAYCREHKYGPTVREIGVAHGWTTNGVVCHLKPLRKKGWISWIDGQARTIQPIGGDA